MLLFEIDGAEIALERRQRVAGRRLRRVTDTGADDRSYALILQAWERLRGTITRIKDQLGLISGASTPDGLNHQDEDYHEQFRASRLSEGHRALFWTRHD